ncbi:MAG: sodium:alanine symporter family protein [Acidobacteria bacterium]|nr:sodium:alanine symporter family protein [Acidobacteriota bacterium]
MHQIWDGLKHWIPIITDDYVWGWGPQFLLGIPVMVILLLGTGITLSLYTGFVQVRKFWTASKLVLAGAMGREKSEGEGDITPYQALMTALSATVGNGNIAGVASAIATGGPGAAFWMWITAIFGMATKYAEAVLGIKYRRVAEDGSMAGGPMYYCQHGIGGRLGRALGIFFASAGAIACLIGTGNMFQTNSMAVAAAQQFSVPQWVTGLVVSILVGMVILGGIRRIARVAEKLVPAMIALYFIGAMAIILIKIVDVPAALILIFESAFNPQAAMGGAVGIGVQQAIRFGVARGILSNESGLGSAPIAHGAARTKDPVRQGQVAMMGTFIDTIVVCSLTAIVITVTGAYKLGPLFRSQADALNSIDMTMHAFDSVIPYGGVVVTVGSLLFGISTLLGWCYYGEKCTEYLFGLRIQNAYRLVFILLMFLGSLPSQAGIQTVIKIGDLGNALMAFPNLLALLLLAREVRRITRGNEAPGG